VGLAGLEGSGQEVFFRVAAGLTRPTQGHVCFEQKQLRGKRYTQLRKNGVAFLSSARLEEGLIQGMSITGTRCSLWQRRKNFWMPLKGAIARSIDKIQGFSHLKAYQTHLWSPFLAAISSGCSSLCFQKTPRFFSLNIQPGAWIMDSSQWIWQQLQKFCERGTGLVFSSSDLEEILAYAERVLVLFEGQVIKGCEGGRDRWARIGEGCGRRGEERRSCLK